MTITAAAARELAERLQLEHEHDGRKRSWRDIANDFPRRPDGSQIVKAGTLNRIANEHGDWVPKDKEILIALGLKKARRPTDQPEWLIRRKKAIRRMAKETRKALKLKAEDK